MTRNRHFKVALVGDPRVGKTSLRLGYMGDKFTTSYSPTLGVDLSVKELKITNGEPSQPIKLHIWDLAGQHNYVKMRKSYLNGAIALLFVYDITNDRSFGNVHKWLNESFDELDYRFVSLVIIGNKVDLEAEKKVDDLQVAEMLNRVNDDYPALPQVQHHYSSAKTGFNINRVFESVLPSKYLNRNRNSSQKAKLTITR